MNYEQALAELNKIAVELENDETGLDKAVELFEKSIELSKICFEKLKQTQGKITKLNKELDKMVETPFIDED